VYLRADSIYKAPMFIPVLLGLVYTRTPWWSAIVAFGAGVLGIMATGYIAGMVQGQPVRSLADLFTDIELTVFGLEMGRYEVNMLVGAIVSTVAVFASAFFTKREGAFKARIENFEPDLPTPDFAAPGTKLDLRGLRAYRLAGWLAIGIGIFLIAFALLTLGEGAGLNLIAALLALGVGAAIIVLTRRYEQRQAARPEVEAVTLAD
ncbi:MAG: hypothetical protein ACR2GR_12275, partial [Rhodothermales bacterium]